MNICLKEIKEGIISDIWGKLGLEDPRIEKITISCAGTVYAKKSYNIELDLLNGYQTRFSNYVIYISPGCYIVLLERPSLQLAEINIENPNCVDLILEELGKVIKELWKDEKARYLIGRLLPKNKTVRELNAPVV